MKPRPTEQTSYDEVKRLHNNSDIDESPRAQHHTLGILPNQASPGDHIHDGRTSRKLDAENFVTTFKPYTSIWSGTGLTYTGTPTVAGYILFGSLCHFRIRVNLTTVTNFGTGQYFLTLPFEPADDYVFRDGGIHANTGSHYALMADAEIGELAMSLWHPGPGGQDAVTDHNSPHLLTVNDYFYISGTYEISQ